MSADVNGLRNKISRRDRLSCNPCRACLQPAVKLLKNFGDQPLCNRFLQRIDEPEYRHALGLGFCKKCGIVQQLTPAPAAEVRPRFDWITYSEPEGHLDRLAGVISQLPGVGKDSVIGGISFKDDSTLARLNQMGFSHTWRLDPKEDLDVSVPGAGLETLQERLTPSMAKFFLRRRGRCQVLLVRHILEHVHDLRQFMDALKEIVLPGGYVFFEIPDCTRALEKNDYSTVWEEHIFYLTPLTYESLLRREGFHPIYVEEVPYSLENMLVTIGRFDNDAAPFLSEDHVRWEERRALAFANGLEVQKTRWRSSLQKSRQSMGPVAMLGAGHLSCAFTNLLHLEDLIDFYVDDNPQKQGLLMPGSHRPIYPSSVLLERKIKVCLMSVSSENEPRVIAKNQDFIKNGGSFRSIFPDSVYAMGGGDPK